MNQQLWEKAIEYHGHKCLGVALGFRMGIEAKQIFGTSEQLCCKLPARNCLADGITVTTGASEENGRITIDPSVKHPLFYLPDDEEGWMFLRKEINFPNGEDAINGVLTGSRDFIFNLVPVDLD